MSKSNFILILIFFSVVSESAWTTISEPSATAQIRPCRQSDYPCINAVFIRQKQNLINEDFHSLMDEMDLASDSYIVRFSEQIIHLLNSEGLNFTDMQLSLNALRAINTKRKSILLKMIENDLLRIKAVLEKAKPTVSNKFIFIFKKTISVNAVLQLKTTLLKIPFYIINMQTPPVRTNTRDYTRNMNKPAMDRRRDLISVKVPKAEFILTKADKYVFKEGFDR